MKDHHFFCPIRTRCPFALIKRLRIHRPSLILALIVAAMAGQGAADGPPPAKAVYFVNQTSIRADFDNDNQLDLATFRRASTSYTIEIQLSSRPEKVSYSLPTSAFISFVVCDIDGDGYDDLILFNGTSPQLLGMWLNDGDQSRFESGQDGPHSNTFWCDARAGYKHNRDREAPVFISPTHRLPFDQFPLGFLWTTLNPEKSLASESPQPFLQTLSCTLHGRSPPRPSLP